MIKKESRQSFGRHCVGIFAVLVLDPLQAERGVFLSLHLAEFGRIGAKDFVGAFAFHEVGDITGRCPMNLFDEPADQVPFCHKI
jgi:hypothetical protein